MFKKHVLNNTLTAFLLVVIAGLATMFYSSCKPEAQEPVTEKSVHQAEIDADLEMIREHQAEGNSVFFLDANKNLVENPSEEWLTEHYNQMANVVVERSITSNYRYVIRPTNGAMFSSGEISLGGFAGISFGGCLTSGNTYIFWEAVEGTVPPPTNESITCSFNGSGTCSASGKIQVSIKRYNVDLSCYCTYNFTKTVVFNQPSTTSNLGNYVCGSLLCTSPD